MIKPFSHKAVSSAKAAGANQLPNSQTYSPKTVSGVSFTGFGSSQRSNKVQRNPWKDYVSFLQDVDVDDPQQMRVAFNVMLAHWRDAFASATGADSLGSVPMRWWVAHLNKTDFPTTAWNVMFLMFSNEQMEDLLNNHLQTVSRRTRNTILKHCYRSATLSSHVKKSIIVPAANDAVLEAYEEWKKDPLSTEEMETCVDSLVGILITEGHFTTDDAQAMEYDWWSLLYRFSDMGSEAILKALPGRHVEYFFEEHLTNVPEAKGQHIIDTLHDRNSEFAGIPPEWIHAQYYRKNWLSVMKKDKETQ